MSIAPISTVLLRSGIVVILAGSAALQASEALDTTDASPEPRQESRQHSAQEQAYRQEIENLESNQGAYGSALSEQLLSLGVKLQSDGEHPEAIALFRRGVHLARINNGLYSAEQIPLLQREISSHIAMGEYSKADERQRYLYRVQMRSLGSSLNRADAFMQQAMWQYNAYQLGVNGLQYNRLMNMWDLYRLALNDIVDREGQTSASLMRPLEGMLLAQYLIASYRSESDKSSFSNSDNVSQQHSANRFNTYRAQSYVKGRSVIQAMYDIQAANQGDTSAETAEALTMMGDWSQWSGENEAALLAYQEAIAELVAQGAAEQDIDEIFGAPVALPDYDGARRLPQESGPGESSLQLEFTVNDRGKVRNLERMDDNELSGSQVNRLMRRLRKTRFRPALTMGEPVTTHKVIKAYEIK